METLVCWALGTKVTHTVTVLRKLTSGKERQILRQRQCSEIRID